MPIIAPSILAADFVNLEEQIRCVEQAGARYLHIDVMDGHFVPNLTVGVPVVRAIRRITGLFLDVHLMVTNPDRLVDPFIDAGADGITVHFEAAVHLNQLLQSIREKGAQPGISLNPHTPVSFLEEVVDQTDLVLIMSVNPGFGGQKLIPSTLEKVKKTRQLLDHLSDHAQIEMDGGVNTSNVAEVARAGVDILVAGTAVFRSDNPGEAFRLLEDSANRAVSG